MGVSTLEQNVLPGPDEHIRHLQSLDIAGDVTPSNERLTADAKKSTSFLDLPNELRDEIYHLYLPSDELFKVRLSRRKSRKGILINECWPVICYALPLLRNDILAIHYRINTIRFVASRDRSNNHAMLTKWISHYGRVLTGNLRTLQISGAWSLDTLNLVTIKLPSSTASGLEVSISTPDDQWGCCTYNLQDLVRLRLSRGDARQDSQIMQRVDGAKVHGSLLAFAFHLLEAARLAESRQVTRLVSASSSYVHGSYAWDHQRHSACLVCGLRYS